MASERLPEPWRSFLSDIDRAATSEIMMHCIGGFAVSLHYGIGHATGAKDLVRSMDLDLGVLERRSQEELRAYVTSGTRPRGGS